jgi:endoglucanase
MKKISLVIILFFFTIVANNSNAQEFNTDNYAFGQNKKLGRGVNIIGYDPIWQSADEARMKEKHFKLIKEAGFDNVRIPIMPFKFSLNDTNFTINPEFFTTLDWIIEQALANNLMAIVDLHEHHAMQENPLGNKAMFLSMWKQIAEHCKNYPSEVLFEICNEPNMKPEIWNEINIEAHNMLRKSNPTRTIMWGPIYGNQIEFLKDLILPEYDRNIIVAIHYYMPIQFTHQGAPWSTKNKDLSGIEWTNTESEELAVKKDFDIAQEWSLKNNRPLSLGEFGAYDKADMPSRVRWTNFIARQAEARNWSWSYWQFDSDFIVYDIDKDEWVEPILGALIPKSDKISDVFKTNELLGRGINVSGYPGLQEVHYKLIKDAGFSNVRIPVHPFNQTISDSSFTLSPSFFEKLDDAVNFSLKHKLIPIIDLHEHQAMQEDPIGTKPKFLAIWEQLATHYKDSPQEVLFEIANEPNMKPEIWNEIHSAAYKIIRNTNPQRTLLIGTIYGNQIEFLKDLVLPAEDRNIIVTVHYYMPIQFTHQGAEWSEENKNLSGIEWPNSEAEEQAIISDFDIASEWSKANNRPIHLGEFGVYNKTGMDSRIRWTNFVSRQADMRKWSWSYWEFCQGFGIYNIENNTWKNGLLDALIPPATNEK